MLVVHKAMQIATIMMTGLAYFQPKRHTAILRENNAAICVVLLHYCQYDVYVNEETAKHPDSDGMIDFRPRA
jgi:hypothetical protein